MSALVATIRFPLALPGKGCPMSIPSSGMFPRLLVALLLTLPPLWAVGPKADEAALQAAARRAEQLRRQGKPDEAVKEQEGALRMAEKLYGADDLRTADQ